MGKEADLLIEALRIALIDQKNDDNALQMEKYMKNHFPFLGIKSPQRKQISNEFFKHSGLLKEPIQPDFVRELWDMPEREYQYIALDYIEKSLRKINKEHFPLFEMLLTTKSWWDTVDMIAQKPIGKIALDHPEIIQEKIDNWSTDENMWLRRTSIIFLSLIHI